MEKRARMEDIKQSAEAEQDMKLAKEKEEREKAELLRRQRLHSNESLEIEQEPIKLPDFQGADNIRVGFAGESKPCDGYIIRYGEAGAINTDIHLTFNFSESKTWEKGGYYYEITKENKRSFCAKCSKEILKGWYSIFELGYYKRNDNVRAKINQLLKDG